MSNVPPAPALVATAEAAEILGVSVFQIARLAQRGDLPVALQAPGKRGARFFHRHDIDAYADRAQRLRAERAS